MWRGRGADVARRGRTGRASSALGALLSLMTVSMMTCPGEAQPARFRPDVGKCLLGVASAMPGFGRNEGAAVDRFDLSYSSRSDGAIELDLMSKTTGGRLLFAGIGHVNPPDPKMFGYLEDVFSRAEPMEAFLEVDDVSYLKTLPVDQDRVIQTRGEPSYLGFIARREGVPVLPLEPRRGQLLETLQRRFPAHQIILAFTLRDVQILRDRRHLFGEALEVEAARSLREYRTLLGRAAEAVALRNILDLTRAVNRQWPGLDWRQVPAEWFNPLMTVAETGSTFVNTIFADEMAIRDRHALRLLLDRVASGRRVVALAGRSHVEMHVQALTCLMAGKIDPRLKDRP